MESRKNHSSREPDAEALQEKLDEVNQLIRNGIDVWRNRQRRKYLERRLGRS
ncbi:MAG: hypothetical protein ACE5LU_08065 [Anaerolineae bacterium]